MNTNPDHRLTGLEQYSLEKAGYFIRREVVAPDQVAVMADRAVRLDMVPEHARDSPDWISRFVELTTIPAVFGLASDIPGAEEPRAAVVFLGRPEELTEWVRGVYIDPQLPPGHQKAVLHNRRPTFHLVLPLQPTDLISVVPGSHHEPMAAEDVAKLQLDPSIELSGTVRVRLQAGDLLVHAGELLRRFDSAGGVRCPALHFTCGYCFIYPAAGIRM